MLRFLLTAMACLLFAAHFAVAAVPACGAGKQDVAAQDTLAQSASCIGGEGEPDGTPPLAGAEHAKPCHDHSGTIGCGAEPLAHAVSGMLLTAAARDMDPVSQEILVPPPQ
ncbi:MAG: hypothetical protein KF849_16285 [Rhizobiaceae bacterium]|nr:hypothetical protein [Rhizobiaceae bacterium]